MQLRPNQVLFAAVFLLLAGLCWREGLLRKSRADHQLLQERLTHLQQLQTENEKLRSEQTNSLDSKKLRELESENIRLKSKLTKARVETEQPKKLRPSSPASDNSGAPETTPEGPVRSFKAEVQTAVRWNQMLVTGGWKTSPDKQAFFLVQPHIDNSNPGQTSVLLEVKVIDVSNEALERLGIKWETTDQKSSSLKALLSKSDGEALLKSFEKSEGTDILSAPRVLTAAGRQAQISVLEQKSFEGQNYELGPTIDLVPHLSNDGLGIDLTVAAQLNLPRP